MIADPNVLKLNDLKGFSLWWWCYCDNTMCPQGGAREPGKPDLNIVHSSQGRLRRRGSTFLGDVSVGSNTSTRFKHARVPYW